MFRVRKAQFDLVVPIGGFQIGHLIVVYQLITPYSIQILIITCHEIIIIAITIMSFNAIKR
jgi:hypothetical protein